MTPQNVAGTTPYRELSQRPGSDTPFPPGGSYAFPEGVEKWRGLVARYFKPEDVDRALWVISRESGGNPNAVGDREIGGSRGLFQHFGKYWQQRADAAGWGDYSVFDPEANIAVAAALLYGSGGGWQHWSVTHSTQPYHGEWQALMEDRGAVRGWVNPLPGAGPPNEFGEFGVWRPATQWHHRGIDLGASMEPGTAIRAAAGGTIRQYRSEKGGWIIQIDHGGGWITKYMHLGTTDGSVKPYAVEDGATVQPGQIIGYMGDSGTKSGVDHLHFEMIYNGSHIDPMSVNILEGGTNYAAIDASFQYSTPGTRDSRANRAREVLGGFLSNMSRQVAARRGYAQKLTREDVQAQRRDPNIQTPTPEGQEQMSFTPTEPTQAEPEF
jgi:hypothetical protein